MAQGRRNTLRSLLDRLEWGTNDCLEWPGAHNHYGYGTVRWQGKTVQMVHRLISDLIYGPLEQGKELHHTCGNKLCCNMAHLRVVTRREHVMLDRPMIVRHALATHCPYGHPLSGDNLYVWRGGRACRHCRNRGPGAAMGPRPPRPRVTHCPHGHPYSGDNLYVHPHTNKRYCRACRNASARAHYNRTRAAGMPEAQV